MTQQKKEYTVREASAITGLCRALVSRLCQRGKIGVRHDFPLVGSHYYTLSADDICFLLERKNNPPKNARKKITPPR